MLIACIVFGPFLCAVALFLWGIRRPAVRDIGVIVVSALELLLTIVLFSRGGTLQIPVLLTHGLGFKTDGFRAIYAIITAFMWTGASAFAREYFQHEREHLDRFWFFMIVTLGATEGVMLSADLMTAFIFFEILSFTSFTWVIHEETPGAIRAGYTYLFIAVIGGLILFMGLLLLYTETGTLAFDSLKASVDTARHPARVLVAAICILLGFGAKAGMFPLHVWLPKAHPVAPSPASALLSGMLTKVGIYGILMLSISAMAETTAFGFLVLILGLITMVLGAVLALFSIDLKRTLACSSMSQIGFILTGVGMMVLLNAAGVEEGAGVAASGLVLHMVNHSLIKLVLFLCAGVVVMRLHQLDLNVIRGWGRRKKILMIAFALGALSISGVPFFGGYISKTLLHEGIVEGIHHLNGFHGFLSVAEWVFLCSGGMTFAYMLKLFFCLFLEKNKDKKVQEAYDAEPGCMNGLSAVAVLLAAAWMVILGQPAVMTRIAAHMTGFHEILEFKAFSWTNLKGGLISLTIGAVLFLTFVRHGILKDGVYRNLWPARLDLEERVYRPLLTGLLPKIGGAIAAIPGENRILTPVAKTAVKAAQEIAAVPGENKVLRPLAKVFVFLGTFIGRVFDTGTDSLIVLMRRTIMKERKAQGRDREHPGLIRAMTAEFEETMRPLTSNFTFAMLMTCIGILIVLIAVVAAVM